MPNLQQLLSEEIRRLARKEIRTELMELKTQLTTMRKTIAEQNRRIKALEKIVPLPVKPQPSAEVPAEVKPVRITAARIKKLRDKLGFSQGKFAALLGVNLNSVRYWESGKIEPREAQKRKIATIRDMGKRELAKLMAEKNIVIKLNNSEKLREIATEQEQSRKADPQLKGEESNKPVSK